MATAAKTTVAEVEQLVRPGDINPDHIVTPGIYVQRIVLVPSAIKHIEQRTVMAGLINETDTEIAVGVAVGEAVVVRAAAFLRNGDAVRVVASGQHREAAK